MSEAASPPDLFFETFDDPAVRRMLVEPLRVAYGTAMRAHFADEGSNDATFGYNVWWFGAFQLMREVDRSKGALAIRSKLPLFRVGIDDFVMATHRVGHRASDDINKSFPKNEGAAHKMAELQMILPELASWIGKPPSTNLHRARKLILAHLGNEETGLEAVYVCYPGNVRGRLIKSWHYAHPIFLKDVADAPPPSPEPTGSTMLERPGDERIPQARPRRKKKGDEDKGSR